MITPRLDNSFNISLRSGLVKHIDACIVCRIDAIIRTYNSPLLHLNGFQF